MDAKQEKSAEMPDSVQRVRGCLPAPAKAEKRDGEVIAEVRTQWIEWTWPEYNEDIFNFTGCRVKLYETGDWEHSVTVHNRSGHSDWDITGQLEVNSKISGSRVTWLAEYAWTQDLDHGETYPQTARGNSANVRDSWQHYYDETFVPDLDWFARRDN